MPSLASLLLVVAFAAGAALALQATVNAQLRLWMAHPLSAALFSFAIGTLAIVAVALAVGAPRPAVGSLRAAPWWVWTGGVLGAFYIVSQVAVTPRIGAAVFLALVVAGQMITALGLEHVGALGLPRHPMTPGRLLGAALLVVGAVLLRRY
jgi:transporter family-2 protein